MTGQQKEEDSRMFHEGDEENPHADDRGCMDAHKQARVTRLTASLPLQRVVLGRCSVRAQGGGRTSPREPAGTVTSCSPARAGTATAPQPPGLSSGFKDFHARLEYFFAWLILLTNVLPGLVAFLSSSSASHPNKG